MVIGVDETDKQINGEGAALAVFTTSQILAGGR
jgi:hypothetical protein